MDLVKGSGDRRPFEKGRKKDKGKKMQSAPNLSQAKKVKADQASVESLYYKKRGH